MEATWQVGRLAGQIVVVAVMAVSMPPATMAGNAVPDVSTDHFVTTWKTDNPGNSNDTSITIPMQGGPWDVDWDNDGVFDASGIVGSWTRDFGVAGTYTLRIRGDYDAIQFGINSDAQKLIEINQWGTRTWASMTNAFFGARNLQVVATDVPDFSGLTSLLGMFHDAVVVNPDTSNWDTSQVTNMANLFRNAFQAMPDTSGWNTAKVEDMSGMFYNADMANPDVSNWDTALVQDMGSMFTRADMANPDVSDWETGNVESFFRMFNDAPMATPDTSTWDTSSATSMNGMFEGAVSANPDTSNWVVDQVTSLSNMFKGAISANPDVSNWNTSMVEFMESLFDGAVKANPDVAGWVTSKVTNMSFLFAGVVLLDQDLSNWDFTAVLDAEGMLQGVTLPRDHYDDLLVSLNNQTLKPGVVLGGGDSQFCSSQAVTARSELISVDSWDITDGGWAVDNGMDAPCVDANNDFVTTWKTDNQGQSSDTSIRIPMIGGPFDIDTDNDGIFDQLGQSNAVLLNFGATGTYTIRVRGSYDSIRFSTSSFGQDKLKLLEINQWGTNTWATMNTAFDGAANLEVPALDTPDFSAVADMNGMFRLAEKANPNTRHWNTGAVTTMNSMFRQATSANPDVTQWNTSSLEDAGLMFFQATSFDRNMSAWDITSLTSASSMLSGVKLSTFNYDSLLIGWNAQTVKKDVVLSAGESRYCTDAAIAARDNLTVNEDWLISDGGALDSCPPYFGALFGDGFESQ